MASLPSAQKCGKGCDPFGLSGQVFNLVGWMLPKKVSLVVEKRQNRCELRAHHGPDPHLRVVEMRPSFFFFFFKVIFSPLNYFYISVNN